MIFAFDIETSKNDWAKDYFQSSLAKPNSRLKNPLKIEEDLQKQYAKAALSWWLGKVVCITARSLDGNFSFIQVSTDEKKLLVDFAEFLKTADNKYMQTILVGKSSKEFDFPFLVGRYLAHNTGIPKVLMTKRQIVDVDEMFAQWGRNGQTTSLNNYAWGLNIVGKTDQNGAHLIDQWLDSKNYTDLTNYCDQDTKIVMEMLLRYRPYGEDYAISEK